MNRIAWAWSGSGLMATVLVLATVTSLAASPAVQVPEPGSAVLLSVGIAAIALGSRWMRHK